MEHTVIRQVLFRQFCAEQIVKEHTKALSSLNQNGIVSGSLLCRIATDRTATAILAREPNLVVQRAAGPADVAASRGAVAYQVSGNNDVRGMYHRIFHQMKFGHVYESTTNKYLFDHHGTWHFSNTNPLLVTATTGSLHDGAGPATPVLETVMSCVAARPSDLPEWRKRRGNRFVVVRLKVSPSVGDVMLMGDHDALAFEPDMLQQKADKAAVERAKLASYAEVLRKRISTGEDTRERWVFDMCPCDFRLMRCSS